MMTGGTKSFGAGGYQKTPLADLLPVVMSGRDPQLKDAVKMVPTREGRTNAILQIASPDKNQSRWEQLPELKGANVLRIKPGSGAQVLAESPTKIPLMIAQNVGRARVLAFAGDTTWQWAFQEDWGKSVHQRFWLSLIHI